MLATFYAHGKLLLSAEYLVLQGAQALAVPTQRGQRLTVYKHAAPELKWKSLDLNQVLWFKACISLPLQPNHKKDIVAEPRSKVLEFLLQILHAAQSLNPNFLATTEGFLVETQLEFDRNWGLGSSSTLIYSIAQWAKVDAFDLQRLSIAGSGYDIACAGCSSPILYRLQETKPIIKEVVYDPVFASQLFFVHLKQKQNSQVAVARFLAGNSKKLKKQIREIQKISNDLLSDITLLEFRQLIDRHEQIISALVQLPTVKSKLFSDYPGSIKSLGAWGGDFVLATGNSADKCYFSKKGYTTIINYEDMVIRKKLGF